MRILIWGYGDYYKKKEKRFLNDTIVAFVSSKEIESYGELKIIKPKFIFQYAFDRLYIMAGVNSVFEILNELKKIGYQEWDKVILGWNVEPYIQDEFLLCEDGKFSCDKGICVYNSQGQTIEVRNKDEWMKLRQKKVRGKSKNEIAQIPSEPVSRVFGMDRGLPIDRYYIEKFLEKHSYCIKGVVLEVSERTYTVRYGTNVKKSYIMHVCDSVEGDCIITNLETGEGVVEEMADCFILTQTLPFIFDIKAAVNHVVRFLKRGGTALVTVPGITQISRYDMERWGHYWSFTTASLKRLFEGCSDVEKVDVYTYGNVKTVVSGLYGLAEEDMNPVDFEYQDEDYQQLIAAVVRKSGGSI